MSRMILLISCGLLFLTATPLWGQCQDGADSLCLNGNRFLVTAEWETSDGASGSAQAVPLTGDTGYFWFFDEEYVELIVKVLDGCPVNNRFWIFAAGLTDAEVELTVEDTATSAQVTYSNPLGSSFQPVQDVEAFTSCPSATGSPATVSESLESAGSFESFKAVCGESLCLNDQRFQVSAEWHTADGSSGLGEPVSLTEDTGLFWFFDPENVELVVKIMDGCSVNDRYWVFAAGLTDVEVEIEVTDTETGEVASYSNAQGSSFQPIQDTAAFETCEGVGSPDPPVIGIRADRPSGTVSSVFGLEAMVLSSPDPVVDWSWELGDGRTDSGNTIDVTYGSPGVYSARVTATTSAGAQAQAVQALTVLGTDGSAAPGLGISNRLGDVDGDGSKNLLDALVAAQAVAGLVPALSSDSREAGDLTFDSTLTLEDVSLLGRSVLLDRDWPRHLEPSSGPPGRLVRIYSPELLDPEALIEIEVGSSLSVQTPFRAVPGFVTAQIPLDPTTGGSINVQAGPLEVRIISDGQVVDVLTFELESPPSLPDDPKAELSAFFDLYLALLDEGEIATSRVLDQVGVSAQSHGTLMAMLEATEKVSREAISEWQVLLDGPQGDALAELFFRYLAANGVSSFMDDSRQFLLAGGASVPENKVFSPQEVCDIAVPALCVLQTTSALIDQGSEILGYFCDVLLLAGVSAIVFPFDGVTVDVAVISGWLAACGNLELTFAFGSVVRDLVGDLDPRMSLLAPNTSPMPGEAVSLTGELEILGLDQICELAADQAADALRGQLANLAVERLFSTKLEVIGDLIELLSPDILMDLKAYLAAQIGLVISELGIGDAFSEFAGDVCAEWGIGLPLPFALQGALNDPVPNIGTLEPTPDGGAEFRCPSGPGAASGLVELSVSKPLCNGETADEEVFINCGGSAVTITMGDNGSLLDDIFEVRLSGETILTSSVPVREISTTIDLAPGSYAVDMLGRAAPDGIGTYYIVFTGASVIGGDPLSGGDLTPGVTKTFLIEVP